MILHLFNLIPVRSVISLIIAGTLAEKEKIANTEEMNLLTTKDSTETKTIYQRGRKVIITTPKLSDWEGGVIITCKRCGNKEIVREDSLCDIWKLCRACAKEDIEAGRMKVRR